jgi:L-sorbose 1-phosphate reductase
MKTRALRLYGKKDLRVEEFELPSMKEDEILARVVSDSICMSTYKASLQGNEHKRVPDNIADHPVIVGHEFAGEIVAVGKKWQDHYQIGQKFTVQPNMNYLDKGYAPGYSFQYYGGDATYIIIPNDVMEGNYLLSYTGNAFFTASLAEPMSCIVAAFHSSYHTEFGVYQHKMGIKEGGKMAILAGVGPMGMGAIDYALHCDRHPGLLVVTDIDDRRLQRAASVFSVADAKKNGVELKFINTKELADPAEHLRQIAGGEGFDDVFVFAPVRPVVELGDKILGMDGCLNFFAGPTDKAFSSAFNFYNVHYLSTHIVGTSGGNTDDMKESLDMMSSSKINPAVMITHVGGLNSAAATTLNLPNIPGGKKLIYTNIDMELTAIDDFKEKGKQNALFSRLAEIVERNNGFWCYEAEKFLLEKTGI